MNPQDKIAKDEYEIMKARLSDIVGGDPQKLEILLNTKLMTWLKGSITRKYNRTFYSGPKAGETHEQSYTMKIKRDVGTAKILLPKEIEKLHSASIITDEERSNFEAMLKSPDEENILMAELSINELRKKRLAKEARQNSKKKMKTVQETFNELLTHFANDTVQLVTNIFKDEKRLDPVVIGMVIKDGKPGIAILEGLAPFFRNDQSKELAARIIKEAAKEIKPVAIMFATEAWLSVKKIKDLDNIVDKDGNYKEGVTRPADDPDRKEVIMIYMETFDKEGFYYFDIIRNGEEVSLKKRDCSEGWVPKGTHILKSRFGDLLKDNYNEMAESIRKDLEKSVN